MGRSVDYLTNAQHVAYFNWPTFESGEEDDYECEPEDADYVIEDIQETIKSHFPEFSNCDRWGGREVHIILEGYGCEIGLSEYCGLATLSIRVDDSLCYDEEIKETEDWIDANWPEISKHWDMYRKVGTFSNGEAIYELKK